MNNQDAARLNNSAEKLKDTGTKAAYDIKEAGKQTWEATRDSFEEAKSVAKDAYQSGKKLLKDNVGEYASTVDEVEAYVRENPLKSVLIGIGLLVLTNRIVKRS